MKATRLVWLLYVLSTVGVLVQAFDPFTVAAVVGGVSVIGGIYSHLYHERCTSKWISFNPRGLKTDLENQLFGQHIASPIIFKAVKGFVNDDNSQKPLVLSLHGWSGTGKNFVSKMIVKSIYRKGLDSKFVHLFTSTKHFPHASQIAAYKSWLQRYIENTVSSCERSMFIFDEMDKMQPGLIDIIKPYLDYYDALDRVSYRKSIFIFLSNAGGQSIVDKALDFWKAGQAREEIQLKDLEVPLSLSVFNNNHGGFFHTSLIDMNLVDFFVPFLPLEHRHVMQCVMAEMKARNLLPDRDVAHKLAEDLIYFPKSEPVFSATGCKTIEKKLPYYI